MSENKTAPEFSREEFDAIEAAVMETNRGRQFLDEYARRHRARDTGSLLDAIARLENLIAAQQPAVDLHDPDLDDLACAIAATSEDIAKVRNDLLPDKGKLASNEAVFASLSGDATQIASALISTAEALQASISDLRHSGAGAPHVDAMDASVSSLFENGWRQDILAQRITKAMRLLTHLQDSLGAHSMHVGAEFFPTEADATKIDAANLKFFALDEDMFEPAVEPDEPQVSQVDPAEAGEPARVPITPNETAGLTVAADKSAPVGPDDPDQAAQEETGTQDDGPVETTSPFAHLDTGTTETAVSTGVPDEDPAQTSTCRDEAPAPRGAAADTSPSDPADDAGQARDVLAPAFSPSDEERKRIVVIRKNAKQKPEIPFADFLDAEGVSDAEYGR